MEDLLTYFLQVNLLLTLLFIGYRFLLSKLTFYVLNRAYFIIGTVYAFVFPLIDVQKWLVDEMSSSIPIIWHYLPLESIDAVSESYSLYDILVFVFFGGVVFLFLKFILQLLSLYRIHANSTHSKWRNYFFKDVIFPIVPFSFFNKIYIHKAQHLDEELQDIFEHEHVHVKGLHTWDILLFEMLLIGCWYNPFVWLMRKAVRQNLEYLTDQQVLNKGVDRQAYQYSLLHVTQQGGAVDISNQFNFKTLKKRIMMMNKKRSSRLELSKYAFLLPIMLLAGASFTVSQAENKIEEVVDLTKEISVDEMTNSKSEKKNLSSSKKDTIKVNSTQEYPLLAPNFDKKALEKGDFYYAIDGKLVSLDEFLAFPRTEISGVDIYKDKQEIFNKIGKKNADGYFVMTSKKTDVKNFSGQDTLLTELNKVVGLGPKKAYFELSAGEKPLIVLDGVTYSDDILSKIHPDDIKSVTVLKDRSITERYGEKGKNGVILIETKSVTNNSLSIAGVKGETGKDQPIDISIKEDGVSITRIKSPSDNVVFGANKNAKLPLIVVDGIAKKKEFRLDDINPTTIGSINVIKDKGAVDKYGENAKGGAIEVITKTK